jgi:hypothetical protein
LNVYTLNKEKRTEPLLSKQIRQEKKTVQSSARKNRGRFFLPLSLGMTARHPQVLHPSAVKLKSPGRIGKRGHREYTHIHMGIHEDI